MKLSLSEWASIAEIVSGFAVVATLIMLFAGISENTEVTRASMYANGIESLNQLNHTIASDPDLSRMWSAFHDQRTGELTDAEKDRLETVIVSMFRTYDTAFSMSRYNLLGDNERERFERQICANMQTAADAGYAEIVHQLTSDDFTEFTETACLD